MEWGKWGEGGWEEKGRGVGGDGRSRGEGRGGGGGPRLIAGGTKTTF